MVFAAFGCRAWINHGLFWWPSHTWLSIKRYMNVLGSCQALQDFLLLCCFYYTTFSLWFSLTSIWSKLIWANLQFIKLQPQCSCSTHMPSRTVFIFSLLTERTSCISTRAKQLEYHQSSQCWRRPICLVISSLVNTWTCSWYIFSGKSSGHCYHSTVPQCYGDYIFTRLYYPTGRKFS